MGWDILVLFLLSESVCSIFLLLSQLRLKYQDWPGVSDNIVFFDTILQNAPIFQKLDKHIYTGKIEPLFVDSIFNSFDLLDI